MREQAAAYRQLEVATGQLSAALVRGAPEAIESLTRAGEGELLRMRSRLLQIMSALTRFADARAAQSNEALKIAPEARREFEEASSELMRAADAFEKTRARASVLATGGASFASACIERCGVPPTTYRAPYSRRGEAGKWA